MHEKRDRKIDEGQRNGCYELPILNEKFFHAEIIANNTNKKKIYTEKKEVYTTTKERSKEKNKPLTITYKQIKKEWRFAEKLTLVYTNKKSIIIAKGDDK